MNSGHTSARWWIVTMFLINATVITAWSTTTNSESVYDAINTTPEPLCRIDTCLNGGTCRELEDWECSNELDTEHTVCLCTTSFTGIRCEYNISCGGRMCAMNEHCVSDKCVSLTDSADSKAPQCKPGIHQLTYQLDMRDRKKPIVCLDMYYTNASSYCHDTDDSIEFQIVHEEVENLFCLNLDYRLWQTCLHVNTTFNKYNFPDKPVSKVTLVAKENDMHPRTDTIVFSVTFNTAPRVEMTSKTYIVNVAELGSQFSVNVSQEFGVSDNDTLTYHIRVADPRVGIATYTGKLVVNFDDSNEEKISVDIEIRDTGIPMLTTVVTVKIEVLSLSCDIREHVYVNYQHIGNPVSKLNCRIGKGYDMSDLYISFVRDPDLELKLMPDGILKVVKGEYGERNVSISVTLKGETGEISVNVPFSITIADIWTGSYEWLYTGWQQVYADQRYPQFRSLQSQVINQMSQFFRTQHVSVKVNVEMFSKSSDSNVTVHFILIFPNGDSSASAVTELRRSFNNGFLGGMRVNETRLIINNQVGSTQVSQIEYSSPDASNTPEFTKDNTVIQLMCTGTFVQPVGDVTMEWRMTSRNALVVPLSNSRLQTNLTSPYEGHYVGTLTADKISFKDSGDFQCSLRDEGDLISSMVMKVIVIPRPVVTLLPMKRVVIRSGEDITLSCNLTRPTDYKTDFHWFMNGKDVVGTSSELSFTGGGVFNATYWCEGENEVGVGERSLPTTVTIIGADHIRCDKEGKWHGTRAGSTAEYPCPAGSTAVITRYCGEDGRWLDEDSNQCAVRGLERVIDDIEWIEEGLRVANISTVARAISENTQPSELSSKWIVLALQALGRLLNITEGCSVIGSKQETKQFIEGFLASVSNILDSRAVGEWTKLAGTKTSPTAVLQLLDRMTDVITNCLSEGDVYTTESANIELKVGKTDPAAVKDIEFSTNSDASAVSSNVYVKLESRTLKQLTDATVTFSVMYYKNISSLLPTGGQITEPAGGASGKNGSRNLVVNSALLAFNLFPAPTKALDPPLKMNFIHKDLSLTGEDRMCVYLNTSRGLWDSNGCNVSISGQSFTECSCGHLTNFALLMSPEAKQILIRHPLTLAEIACCSVAIVLLVLTVVVYAVTWRYIRSDQGVIVIHICVCLAVALLLLLIGIGRDEFGLCIAFAVAVHFFYMATFCMMLASGLEALWSDSNLFQDRSKLKPLLIGAWGLTVLVVVISCSQLQVYEPGLHCWLSLMGDMKWLFIFPVLIILIVNFIVTGKMIHNHLGRRASRLQDAQDKETNSLHWMCFLLPVLGLSWIFGLLTVQDGSEIYDYLFAIINVLQGLMIFITQCIANKQVRKGIASLRRPGDQRPTEGELEMDALSEDADKEKDARASGAYHFIDDTQRSSVVREVQHYEALNASQGNDNVYEDMDPTALQTGVFAKEFSEENQYANELANPVGGGNRMQDPADKSGDRSNLPLDAMYRNVQDTERRPMIPSSGDRR